MTTSITGAVMPVMLYGTAWKRERTAEYVLAALEAGFRGVDTAGQPKHYDEAGVGGALGLPPNLVPELILMVGHPRPVERQLRPNAPKPVRIEELTYWEEVGNHAPS